METKNVDYKELLDKYIKHSYFCGNDLLLEDTDILDTIVDFTKEEIEVLRNIKYE